MPPLPHMSDFTRVIWSNGSENWQRIISKISEDWLEFEQIQVKDRKRDAFITVVAPENLVEFSQEWMINGCSNIVMDRVGVSVTYNSTTIPFVPGDKFNYRCLVYRINKAYSISLNDVFIGQLLGYPSCCIDFFDKWWNKEKFIDTTWPMFLNTKGNIFQECNILLRYLGLRYVFHLPCSFDCWETKQLAVNNIGYFNKLFPKSAEKLHEILSWPVEWSAVNGIAEIKTPICKISARTDYFEGKKVVRLEGTMYPQDGENGIVFPYTRKKELSSTNAAFFVGGRRGNKVSNKVNGFSDEKSQSEAHNWLANELMKYIVGKDFKTFIDLGAGDGSLILQICRNFPQLAGIGIDKNIENDLVTKMDIRDWNNENKFDIALIAEQRFTDCFTNKNQAIKYISKYSDNIFIYNYTTHQTEFIKVKESCQPDSHSA